MCVQVLKKNVAQLLQVPNGTLTKALKGLQKLRDEYVKNSVEASDAQSWLN